jgi:hypothetical protein
MEKYQKGKIYKIISDLSEQIYIGSTCQLRLSNRFGGHVRTYRRYLQKKQTFCTSFELIKNNDAKIVLVEKYPCMQEKDFG